MFVSYSRHDEALVKPLAALLGVAVAKDSIFLDVDSLVPGDVWGKKIIAAILECSVFVLCWCCETERSAFVAKEIKIALRDGKKRVVPVLLCSTKMPFGLLSRQWIDLRECVVHRCDHGPRPTALDFLDSPAGTGRPRTGDVAIEALRDVTEKADNKPTVSPEFEPLIRDIAEGKFVKYPGPIKKSDIYTAIKVDHPLTIEEDEEAQRLATTIRSYFNALRTDARPSG